MYKIRIYIKDLKIIVCSFQKPNKITHPRHEAGDAFSFIESGTSNRFRPDNRHQVRSFVGNYILHS